MGSHVKDLFNRKGALDVVAIGKKDFDFRDVKQIANALKEYNPDIIVYLAAVVGGIGANMAYPGSFFYENALMGIQLIEQARLGNVSKLVIVGTVCAYPRNTPVPFREDYLWMGYPEETNAPYGLAKKMLLVQSQAYRKQYGFNSIYLLPVNLYGPRDNFDLDTGHVIPAIIRKCVHARNNNLAKVVLWGDGSPTREFLYVEDAAEGIIKATEHYDGAEPVNLGSGEEISIAALSQLIVKMTGFNGEIEFDSSKPNGQPRRCLDTERAEKLFEFVAKTPLSVGLQKTIDFFESSLI